MRHKEERLNTIRRMKLEAIKKIVQDIPVKPDTRYNEMWEVAWDKAESELANKIRDILSNLPKGWAEQPRSIKNIARDRFLEWKEMQAKGEWRTMSEEEQHRWIGYTENHTPWNEVRAIEMERVEKI